MRRRIFFRQLDLVLLALAAVIWQAGKAQTTCTGGSNWGYPTQSFGKGGWPSGQGSVDPVTSGSPTGWCILDLPDGGSKVYSGSGPGAPNSVELGVLPKNGYKPTAKEAEDDLKANYSPPKGASSGGNAATVAAPKVPTIEQLKDPAVGQMSISCLGIDVPASPPPGGPHSQPHPAPKAPATDAGDPSRSPAAAGPVSPDPKAGAPNPPGPQGQPASAGPAAQPAPNDPLTIGVPNAPPGGAVSQNNNNVISTMVTTSAIADTARGGEIIDAMKGMQKAYLTAANDDQKTLAENYKPLSPEALGGYLERARNTLGDAASALENATGSSLESSERARFQNYFLNARDKAQLGLDAIHEDQNSEGALGSDSPFKGLLGAKDANPLAKSAALAGIFGAQMAAANAATNDSLVNRLVMLNGLPEDQRAAALQRLKLLEHAKLTLANGTKVTLDLLHNGYLLGGGATAVDCSSFVSSVLPADVRKGRFTTLDFRAMWIYARTQKFPMPPKYEATRAKLVKQTSDAFMPIDLYAGEPLTVGDILVYRLQSDPIGHVVIVQNYNPATLRAEIVEASQTAGGIRERTINLSADPLEARRRLLMPGLWALRIKPVTNHACYYRESARMPANLTAPDPDAPRVRVPERTGTPDGNTGGAL